MSIDRREAGVELVRKWKLPPLFERVIAGSKAQDPDLSVFDCPALIEISCGLADALGLGVVPLAEGEDWMAMGQQLLARVPETDRNRLNYNLEDLQLTVVSKVNLLDSEAAK